MRRMYSFGSVDTVRRMWMTGAERALEAAGPFVHSYLAKSSFEECE